MIALSTAVFCCVHSLILSLTVFFFVSETVTYKCIVISQFYISFNDEQFYIKLPDGHMMNFPNQLGDVKYKYFDVSGDARIIGIKIK